MSPLASSSAFRPFWTRIHAHNGPQIVQSLEIIRKIIATELGVPASDLHDAIDLAEVGCDSLMSLLILSTLKSELGLVLPPSFFIDCATVAELRTYLSQTPAAYSERRLPDGIDLRGDEHSLEGVKIQPPLLLQKAQKQPAKSLFLFLTLRHSVLMYTTHALALLLYLFNRRWCELSLD